MIDEAALSAACTKWHELKGKWNDISLRECIEAYEAARPAAKRLDEARAVEVIASDLALSRAQRLFPRRMFNVEEAAPGEEDLRDARVAYRALLSVAEVVGKS